MDRGRGQNENTRELSSFDVLVTLTNFPAATGTAAVDHDDEHSLIGGSHSRPARSQPYYAYALAEEGVASGAISCSVPVKHMYECSSPVVWHAGQRKNAQGDTYSSSRGLKGQSYRQTVPE